MPVSFSNHPKERGLSRVSFHYCTKNDLLKLVHDFLIASKLPTAVLTGPAAFPVDSEEDTPTSTVVSEKSDVKYEYLSRFL